MAIVKVTNSKASLRKAINYITQEEKTEDKLVSGINCTPETALDEMKATKEQYRKTDGRQYAHYIHSFKPGEDIDHSKAHKLALELAEKRFKGYEVLIATHKDKDHIHSHIIVNSVSYENGAKLHSSKKDLEEIKELSNELCRREGLSITKPNRSLTSFKSQKYRALEKGVEGNYKSYMLDLWKNVNSSMKIATSKEQFISLMNEKGYQVNWSDSRKNITYITPENKRVRDKNLAKTFKNEKLFKEGLLNEFRRNGEKFRSKGISDRGATGDNREVARDTKDIGKEIIFGQYGRNKVHGSRNDEFIKTDKTEQRETGAINRAIENRETVSRTENNRTYAEVGQSNTRVATGNGRIEGHQLQQPKNFDRINKARPADYQQLSEQVSRNIEADQRHGESENMERQSNPIHNTTRGDSRIDIDDSRSLSSDNLLDKIVSRFDEPLKKLEEKEKEKKRLAELEAKAKERLRAERQKPRTRRKTRDLGYER